MVTWSNHLPITQQQSNPSITHSEFTLGTLFTQRRLHFDSSFCRSDDSALRGRSITEVFLFRRSVSVSEECSRFGGAVLFRRSGLVSEEWSCLGGELVFQKIWRRIWKRPFVFRRSSDFDYSSDEQIFVLRLSISYWREVSLEVSALKLSLLG